MKSKTSTIKTISTLSLSRENVNSCNVSSENIFNDIIANGWQADSVLVVAGENVPRHIEGAVICGNNRFQALTLLNESVLELVLKTGVKIRTVSDVSERELADLYADNSITKAYTVPMLAKQCAKYMLLGVESSSRASLAERLASGLDLCYPLTGDKAKKVEVLKLSLASNHITMQEFKSEFGKVRGGAIQQLQSISFNDVALRIAELKFNEESTLDIELDSIYGTASYGDMKKLQKAYNKDAVQLRAEDGLRTFSKEQLACGDTTEFKEAMAKLLKTLQEKANKEPSEKKQACMTRAEVEALQIITHSVPLQKVLRMILKLDDSSEWGNIDNAIAEAISK